MLDDGVVIGLDVPGPLDKVGRVGMLPNIELESEGLRVAIQQAFANAHPACANDGDAVALGELWRCAMRKASR